MFSRSRSVSCMQLIRCTVPRWPVDSTVAVSSQHGAQLCSCPIESCPVGSAQPTRCADLRCSVNRETACLVGKVHSCTREQLNRALPTVHNQLRATLTGAQLPLDIACSENVVHGRAHVSLTRALTTRCAVI